MKVAHPNWKNLPFEILHEILGLASISQNDLETRNYAIVCKAWLNPARAVLYSTVIIRSHSKLQKFHDTVKNDIQLGEKVKNLTIASDRYKYWSESAISASFDLKINLLHSFLPNVEFFEDATFLSYTPVLYALEDGRLKHLKKLALPHLLTESSEVGNYTNCAFHMKDRLEQLLISDNYSYMRGQPRGLSYSSQLYDKLNQFEKLAYLILDKNTNREIQVLEYIIQSCKSLKNLRINFLLPDTTTDFSPRNDNISMDMISAMLPTYTIKSLNTDIDFASDTKTLLYIMHKFQNLDNLRIHAKGRNSACRIDRHKLTRLLTYSSKIKSFKIFPLTVALNEISDSVGKYWDTYSKPGKERVSLYYEDGSLVQDVCSLRISNQPDDFDFTLSYPISNINYQYLEFLERNGNHIGELAIQHRYFVNGGRPELPENYISHIFTHCQYLHVLHFDTCALKDFTYSNMDLSKKFFLDEIHFTGCNFNPSFFERLSLLVPKLKRLRLSGYLDYIDEDRAVGNPHLEVTIPTIQIDTVIFEQHDYYDPIYLKVFASTSGKYKYYLFEDEELKISSQEDYTNTENGIQIYICCPDEPNLVLQ